MTTPQNITLIGCGKMGTAMLQSWLKNNINADFSVIDPTEIKIKNVTHYPNIKTAQEALKTTTTLILAIKPQIMQATCAEIKHYIGKNTLILSIAAGQSLEKLQAYFSKNQPIIRAMPNTPAAIDQGMSVSIANQNTTKAQKQNAQNLLESCGKCEWITDETLMDAVTALSGSGPAYLFHLIETLSKAGQNAGLSLELSTTLARQTVIGASALSQSEPETPASILRENVTSKGGTTAAALEILMNGEIQEIYNQALIAARDRSKELNG